MLNLIYVAVIIAFAADILTNADILPAYEIHVWDKNHAGGLHITSSVQCNCSWYYNVQGISTRVSNDTVLRLNQESVYDEYCLLDDQRQAVMEYALVVPNSNAGTKYIISYIATIESITMYECTELYALYILDHQAIAWFKGQPYHATH